MTTPFVAEYSAQYRSGKTSDCYDAPQDGKDYLNKALHIYSLYCSNRLRVFPNGLSGTRPIGELRAYARGEQSIDRYKVLIEKTIKTGADPNLQQKFNFDNISYDNLRVLPKFRSIAVSKIKAPDFDPVIVATDTVSAAEKNSKINMDKTAFLPQMQQLAAQMGAAPQVNKMAAALGGDVDTAAQMGAYLLEIEAAMQDVLQTSFDASMWEPIKEMVASDLIDIGIMGVGIKFHEREGRMGLYYLDPAGLIVPLSDYPDCRDIPFFGHVRETTIGALKREMMEKPEEYEKEYFKIAKRYASYRPNIPMRSETPRFNDLEFRKDFNERNGRQVYDPFTVCIMDFKWRANKMIDGVMVESVYGGKWVVGTQIVYDCCEEMAIARRQSGGSIQAMLPVSIYCLPGPSLVEKVIANVDDLQMAVLKLRALIANLPPGARRSINLSKLRNAVRIGDKDFDMFDMLALERASGTLLFEGTGEFEEMDRQQDTSHPIQPLQSSITEDINLYQNQINNAMQNIRDATGMNEVADGTARTDDLLIGVFDRMNEASNSALGFEFGGMASIFGYTATVMAKRYQSAVTINGKISLSSIRMSKSGLHLATIDSSIATKTIEVYCLQLPTTEKIEFLKQMVVARVQENKISQADMMVIMGMLDNRNYKLAILFLTVAQKEHEQRMSAARQADMAAQAQAQAQLALTTEQAKQQTLQVEYRLRMQEAQLKQKLDIEKMKVAQSMGVAAKAFEIEAGQLAT